MTGLNQPSLLEWQAPTPPQFGGSTFDADRDGPRLNRQAKAVYDVMADGKWRTLREIAEAAGCPEASASARFRDFSKPEFRVNGTTEKQNMGAGLWRYRLILNGRVE
jgi:hypothetical protein